MISKIKKNYKIAIPFFILGMVASGITIYAATITSDKVSYNNKNSGMSATTMQGALDELYIKSDIRKSGKFVSAYSYSTTTATKCITGEESTCKKSTCYQNKAAGSCKAGDIIKYKVNNTDIIAFHVMYDNGATIRMQSQKSIISKSVWYELPNLTHTVGDLVASDNSTTSGPLTALFALEAATNNWINVKLQTYQMGRDTFKTNPYTGCSFTSCTTNIYTLPIRSARARMITIQEAMYLGCSSTSNSCPIWVTNYTKNPGTGGTVSSTEQDGIWTMNAEDNRIALTLMARKIDHNYAYGWDSYIYYKGLRAVVDVQK